MTVDLPSGCLFEGQTSFERAVCGQEFCTTPTGVCSDDSRMCCCRALQQSIIIPVTDTLCSLLDSSLRVNDSICGCSVCDDLFTTVRVTVIDAENEEEVVSGAQIFDISNDSAPIFLGVTVNGQLEFMEPFNVQFITLQVLAANFLTTNMTVNLGSSPTVQVTVLLTPLLVIEVGLGNSALTVLLGAAAAVSAPANSFVTTAGELYEDVVTYEGVFEEAADSIGNALPPGAQRFVINNNVSQPFVALAVFILSFRDIEGNELQVENLDFVVATTVEQIFIAYFDGIGTWENGGDFLPLSADDSRRKRQTGPGTPILVQEDVAVGTFAIVAAPLNAQCWLQARTFTENGLALSGTFITISQCTIDSGLFMFGTDTGALQTTIDGLVNNAICLPLACDNFTSATLEAQITMGGDSLNSEDFPPGIFNLTENPPVAIGDIFSIQEIVIETPGLPRPFYFGFNACVANGQEALMDTERADYFSFNSGPLPSFPELNCYVKVQILDCFDDNVVTVTSLDPTNNILGTSVVNVDDTVINLDDMEGTGGTEMPPTPMSTFCNASIATIRTVCIPFVCQSNVVIDVAQNPASGLTGNCENTGRSVVLSLPGLSEPSVTELIINTAILRSDDFNDPDLGLFHEMTSAMIAQQLCFAGNGSTALEIDLTTGIAGTFSCFQV